MGFRMASVYYQPAEAMRWLDQAAKESRDESARLGKEVLVSGSESIGGAFRKAAAAAAGFGKSAMADLASKKSGEVTYVLHDDAFEVIKLTSHKKVAYSSVVSIVIEKNDRFEVRHEGGSLTIKPLAHLVAGAVKVPIGWQRAGVEVPYRLLVDELAARCGVTIQAAGS